MKAKLKEINQDLEYGLEAQNENNNLVEIDLSLETQVFLHYHYGSRNRRKLLKTVIRANIILEQQLTNKTCYLSLKAVEIANAIFNKLIAGKEVLLSHKYISKITGCDSSRQNNNIIDQLDNLFDIKHHKFLYRNRKVYRHNVEFKLKASVLKEAKGSGALISEFNWKKISSSYTNNNITSNRSNIDLGSKFPNNSISISSEELASTEGIQNPPTESAESIPLVSKRKFVANRRKKKTKAQRAAKLHKMPLQYDKPKSLAEMESITQKECSTIQHRSARHFTLHAMNEILQDMATRISRSFSSRWQFICYFSKCMTYEKRDAIACSGNNFYIKARKTEAEVIEITTLAERERYLNKTENAGIYSRCDYTQLRAKIAGGFPKNLGYDLLKNMINVKKNDNVFEVIMHTKIELTEHYKQLLLSNVNAVGGYSGVEELGFVYG